MSICAIYVRTSIEKDNTSIDQQIELGKKFCESQNFEYRVYNDVGKSGYKVSDEKDPFKERLKMKELLLDIENKIVDKVWVFEHSRLSRNDNSDFIIKKIFQKYNITVFEKDREFNLNNPQDKMIFGIQSAISEFERNLIVSRITRGVRDKLNAGIRSYHKTYGYRQIGKNGKYITWEPVQSEIENIKFAYDNFLSGRPINNIVKELHPDESEPRLKVLFQVYRHILSRFDYTGFSLTTDATILCNQYKNLEIDSLSFLTEQENDKPKYYVQSINFPVQIVSIESWITSVGKLLENKKIYKKEKRAASSDVFTGIIKCPYCGLNYFSENKKIYEYYTHFPSSKCLQRPKSSHREKINNLVNVFYFYYYLVYEDTNEFVKQNQVIANLNITKVKDKLSSVLSENKKIEKTIDNLQSVYEKSTSEKLIENALLKEADLKEKLESNNNIILKLKSELNQLDAEFKSNLKLLTYEKVKETIINFFEKLSTEEKRTALLKIIKKCALYKNYLLIQAEKLLFIFNVKEDYEISDELYEQFKTANEFKLNFLSADTILNQDGSYKADVQKLLNIPTAELKNYSSIQLNEAMMQVLDIENQRIVWHLVRFLGDLKIMEYRLKTPTDEKAIKEKLMLKEIDYELRKIENVICFTEL